MTTAPDPARTTAPATPTTAATTAATIAPSTAAPATRPERLTVLAGGLLLVICLLHTLVFAVHPYWADWLAGPLRESAFTADEAAQFWGLAGGFVVPGTLFGLLVIRTGREGRRLPPFVGPVLAIWAALCLWIVGPSGFLLVLVPAALLIITSLRRTPRAQQRPVTP